MRRLRPTRLALPSLSPVVAALLGAWSAGPAWSQSAIDQTVVVTGTVKAQRSLDAAFAIGSVDEESLRVAGPQVNLSEALVRVPGLVVANRNNYAQDLQIGSRGFGARATFGVRGIRLYTDGIPASGPDGQGQVAHFDLAGAQRVEVLRGPFSVLYGASSGGVIALFSAPVRQASVEAGVDVGSFGLNQMRTSVAAPLGGGFDLRLSASDMAIDGFRPQSAADRQLLNLRLGYSSDRDSVVFLLNDHKQAALDPLGLPLTPQGTDPASFSTDPRSTVRAAQPQSASNPGGFNTRKTVDQNQWGLSWRHRFDDGGLLRETSLAGYQGERAVTQYLAIPIGTQTPARHGGGVVDFDRRYEGLEGKLRLGWSALELLLGASLDRQVDDRRGYENFVGTTTGVQGRLRRDEDNTATTRDGFVQAEWTLSPAFTATAGVRSGRTKVEVKDAFLSNGDDSGQRKFSYTNPVLGLRWNLSPGWTVHASAARGNETPTLGELAYTADNSGFNTTLKAQRSKQMELGTKWRSAALELDAALFTVHTHDEIGVRSNSGGRASFHNVGSTKRHGAEVSALWRISPALRAQLALSTLQATYQDDFLTCPSAPCPTPTNPAVNVPAGNRIAGTQARTGFAELAWKPGLLPGEFALEVRGQSRTAANDTNSAFAPGFGLVNLRWNHDWSLGELGTLQTLVRLDNAADRDHVGSVIVNDANGRFFETGTPRSTLVSLRWKKTF